jgi:hypothetical protein
MKKTYLSMPELAFLAGTRAAGLARKLLEK